MNAMIRFLAFPLFALLAGFNPAQASSAVPNSCGHVFSQKPWNQWLVARMAEVAKSRHKPAAEKSAPRSFSPSEATRNAFLAEVLYAGDLVEASNYSRLMSDKLFQVQYLSQRAPVAEFFPKTRAFREFAAASQLLTNAGTLKQDKDAVQKIEAALRKAFPNGFVAKPVAGYNTGGKGFYINESQALAHDLVQHPEKFLGTGKDFLFVNNELGLSSGEGWIIQELLQQRPGEKPPEFRVHTFENHVVDGATEARWHTASMSNFRSVNAYVQKFLNLLPREDVRRQAWGLDVVEIGPQQYRIIEINTNRGEQIQWSGYLISSLQLGAHVRFLEDKRILTLTGPHAADFRRNRANLESWVRKEGKEDVLKDLRINDPALAREVEDEI